MTEGRKVSTVTDSNTLVAAVTFSPTGDMTVVTPMPPALFETAGTTMAPGSKLYKMQLLMFCNYGIWRTMMMMMMIMMMMYDAAA